MLFVVYCLLFAAIKMTLFLSLILFLELKMVTILLLTLGKAN
jgi:hypothetical protein